MKLPRRKVVLCLACLACLLWQSACAWAQQIVSGQQIRLTASEHAPAPRVYVFRGFLGYWPRVDDLAEQLQEHGYAPIVRLPWQAKLATKKMITRRRAGLECGPVYILGYSRGTLGAISMAEQLGAEGIAVDRLVLLEAFTWPDIPANVRYCFNLYESRPTDNWFVFRGTPVYRTSRHTQLVSIDIAKDPRWASFRHVTHFTMQDDSRIQQIAVSQFPHRPHGQVRTARVPLTFSPLR